MVAPVVGAAGITALGNLIGGAYGGGEQYDPGKIHSRWADPYQGMLFQDQMKQAMSGGGDFGFGQAAKAGTSQLQQMMADRGISPQSGVGLSATGDMLANAMSQDIGNRRNYTMGLLNTTPMKQQSDQGWEQFNNGYGYGNAADALKWGQGGAAPAPAFNPPSNAWVANPQGGNG